LNRAGAQLHHRARRGSELALSLFLKVQHPSLVTRSSPSRVLLGSKEVIAMGTSFNTLSAFAALAMLAAAGSAMSQPAPANLAGSYSCVGTEQSCTVSGGKFTVTQTGDQLDVKTDKNVVGTGRVTSPITISMGPPWNMLGVIHQAGTIEWSNGTSWKKQ
jgi:hypothetical protein